MRIYPRRVFLCVLWICILLVIHQNAGQWSIMDIPVDGIVLDQNGMPVSSDLHTGVRETRSDTYGDTMQAADDIVMQSSLWHPGSDKYNDRILAQLTHVPQWYSNDSQLRYIYVPGGMWDTPTGQTVFMDQQCLVNQCHVTTNRANKADAVLIQNSMDGQALAKQPGQIWILWLLESPLNSISLQWLQDKINWTASYRPDSTIVTPYEKFVSFSNVHNLTTIPARNYATGKNKLVAWFVSNCNTFNRRLQYAHELQRHINVDIYGTCGNMYCIRDTRGGKCDKMLNKYYKFYLSFENSNCEYYITEKFFWNALLWVSMWKWKVTLCIVTGTK